MHINAFRKTFSKRALFPRNFKVLENYFAMCLIPRISDKSEMSLKLKNLSREQKTRFVEILLFLRKNTDFQGSRAPKINQKPEKWIPKRRLEKQLDSFC